jgi:hypothetical protein
VALWVIETLRLRLGLGDPRSVRVNSLDSSPFMTATAEQLWRSLVAAAPGGPDVLASFTLAPWTATAVESVNGAWVVGSYLFDHSDAVQVGDLASQLRTVLAHHQATHLSFVGDRSKAVSPMRSCRS